MEGRPEEYKIPYIGLVKQVDATGCVRWEKQTKDQRSKAELKQLKALKAPAVQSLATEDKRLWFYFQIDAIKRAAGRRPRMPSPQAILLVIERAYLLRDSLAQFQTTVGLDLRQEIRIHFLDEICQDAGGLIREWFSLVTEELLSPQKRLFKKANTHQLSYVINEHSGTYCENHIEYFFFFGQAIGKALFERIAINVHLNSTLFKRILNTALTVSDLQRFDKELWDSVAYIRDNEISSDSIMSSFSVTSRDPRNGTISTVNLKPNGANIPVTNGNKEEFVELFSKYHMIKSTEEQFKTLLAGLHSVIPEPVIRVLDADELELFLCGEDSIDVADWRTHTVYRGDYQPEHQVIKWFWGVLEKMTNAQLERFLQFCTGSTRVPAEGFRGLMSNNGKKCMFCIEPKQGRDPASDFIVAHTCFNRIELPLYPSMQTLKDSIMTIINSPDCFKFAFE